MHVVLILILALFATPAWSQFVEVDPVFDYERRNFKAQDKFVLLGHNDAVGTSEEFLWIVGGTYPGFLTAASTVTLVSDDAADDFTGDGARLVLLRGLDADFNEVNESVQMDGTTPVVSTTEFIRLNRGVVTLVGTCGNQAPLNCSNQGTISITATTGAVTLSRIDPQMGITQNGAYTVPAGKTAVLRDLSISVSGSQDANVFVHLRPQIDLTGPFGARIRPLIFAETGGAKELAFVNSVQFQEKTDVFVSAQSPVGGTDADVTAIMQLDVYDNIVLNK